MKKSIGTLMVAVSTIALASTASAETFKPYVGLDYAHNRVASRGDYYHSPVINAGVMFNKYVGTELSIHHSPASYGKGGVSSRLSGYNLDVMGYLPIDALCDGDVNLIASAGIGEYKFNAKGYGTKFKDSGYGYRLGAGAMYNLTDNMAVRAMYKYVITDKLQDIDAISEYSVGFRYSF